MSQKIRIKLKSYDHNLVENLNSAIKKDPKLKAAAKTDMEFAKYFESAAFKAVVQ